MSVKIEQFVCDRCGMQKDVFSAGNTFAPEYGHSINTREGKESRRHCWECCAHADARVMREDGRIDLYLTHDSFPSNADSFPYNSWVRVDGKVYNWPGTLSFRCKVKRGAHNIARYRFDAWFIGPDGARWHGVQYGQNTQIIHCKRIK